MAHGERCCVYLSLIALLALIGSLSAIPQTFGPLIRDRSIRPQTSEEELNDNIDDIYRKDFKPPAMAAAQSELVTRADSKKRRVTTPVNASDAQELLSVVRDENGKLMAVFGSPTTPPTTPPAQTDHVVSQASAKHDAILVLRAATDDVNQTTTKAPTMMEGDFDVGSYPADYPFDKIWRILNNKPEMYRVIFEEELVAEALVTRIDSPSDPYLCSSTRSLQYPTYHPEAKLNIVNVKGFYQHVTFEVCDNEGALCSNVIPSSRGKLYCEQVYGMYDVYTVPVGNATQLVKTKLQFPSCCKCRHEAP